MAPDPEGAVTFEAGGKKYTAFFGFRAIKTVERHYDLPFFEALQRAMPALKPEEADDKAAVMKAGASIRFTDVGVLFGAALAKHHDLDEDEVDEMLDEIGFERAGEVLAEAVAAALNREGASGSPANPPKARRKS